MKIRKEYYTRALHTSTEISRDVTKATYSGFNFKIEHGLHTLYVKYPNGVTTMIPNTRGSELYHNKVVITTTSQLSTLNVNYRNFGFTTGPGEHFTGNPLEHDLTKRVVDPVMDSVKPDKDVAEYERLMSDFVYLNGNRVVQMETPDKNTLYLPKEIADYSALLTDKYVFAFNPSDKPMYIEQAGVIVGTSFEEVANFKTTDMVRVDIEDSPIVIIGDNVGSRYYMKLGLEHIHVTVVKDDSRPNGAYFSKANSIGDTYVNTADFEKAMIFKTLDALEYAYKETIDVKLEKDRIRHEQELAIKREKAELDITIAKTKEELANESSLRKELAAEKERAMRQEELARKELAAKQEELIRQEELARQARMDREFADAEQARRLAEERLKEAEAELRRKEETMDELNAYTKKLLALGITVASSILAGVTLWNKYR